MADGFVMSVPADARYRVLASEIARRYAELAGASSADGEALSSAVADAADKAAAADPDGDIALEFRSEAAGIDVTLRYSGRSAVVRHPLPARQG